MPKTINTLQEWFESNFMQGDGGHSLYADIYRDNSIEEKTQNLNVYPQMPGKSIFPIIDNVQKKINLNFNIFIKPRAKAIGGTVHDPNTETLFNIDRGSSTQDSAIKLFSQYVLHNIMFVWNERTLDLDKGGITETYTFSTEGAKVFYVEQNTDIVTTLPLFDVHEIDASGNDTRVEILNIHGQRYDEAMNNLSGNWGTYYFMGLHPPPPKSELFWISDKFKPSLNIINPTPSPFTDPDAFPDFPLLNNVVMFLGKGPTSSVSRHNFRREILNSQVVTNEGERRAISKLSFSRHVGYFNIEKCPGFTHNTWSGYTDDPIQRIPTSDARWKDRNMPAHEFGHMLGLDDRYSTYMSVNLEPIEKHGKVTHSEQVVTAINDGILLDNYSPVVSDIKTAGTHEIETISCLPICYDFDYFPTQSKGLLRDSTLSNDVWDLNKPIFKNIVGENTRLFDFTPFKKGTPDYDTWNAENDNTASGSDRPDQNLAEVDDYENPTILKNRRDVVANKRPISRVWGYLLPELRTGPNEGIFDFYWMTTDSSGDIINSGITKGIDLNLAFYQSRRKTEASIYSPLRGEIVRNIVQLSEIFFSDSFLHEYEVFEKLVRTNIQVKREIEGTEITIPGRIEVDKDFVGSEKVWIHHPKYEFKGQWLFDLLTDKNRIYNPFEGVQSSNLSSGSFHNLFRGTYHPLILGGVMAPLPEDTSLYATSFAPFDGNANDSLFAWLINRIGKHPKLYPAWKGAAASPQNARHRVREKFEDYIENLNVSLKSLIKKYKNHVDHYNQHDKPDGAANVNKLNLEIPEWYEEVVMNLPNYDELHEPNNNLMASLNNRVDITNSVGITSLQLKIAAGINLGPNFQRTVLGDANFFAGENVFWPEQIPWPDSRKTYFGNLKAAGSANIMKQVLDWTDNPANAEYKYPKSKGSSIKVKTPWINPAPRGLANIQLVPDSNNNAVIADGVRVNYSQTRSWVRLTMRHLAPNTKNTPFEVTKNGKIRLSDTIIDLVSGMPTLDLLNDQIIYFNKLEDYGTGENGEMVLNKKEEFNTILGFYNPEIMHTTAKSKVLHSLVRALGEKSLDLNDPVVLEQLFAFLQTGHSADNQLASVVLDPTTIGLGIDSKYGTARSIYFQRNRLKRIFPAVLGNTGWVNSAIEGGKVVKQVIAHNFTWTTKGTHRLFHINSFLDGGSILADLLITQSDNSKDDARAKITDAGENMTPKGYRVNKMLIDNDYKILREEE